MMGNGQKNGASHSTVLRWPQRVLSMRDLHHNLNGHRELVLSQNTVVTPLASDELRSNGIKITRLMPSAEDAKGPVWGVAQDREHPLVESAVRTLARDGLVLRELEAGGDGLPCHWARALAECIARGECLGGVLFCEDPGLVCCVANKVGGLRAVAVTTVGQAARATLTLAANLLAVEMPGRTFFEIRQLLRTCCLLPAAGQGLGCPDGVACTLQELDGHAHR